MTENKPFQRTFSYVGREAEISQLIEPLQDILEQPAEEAACYACIVEADGGMGKTRLMQVYPDLVQARLGEQAQPVRIARIIDFDEYVSRSPRTIEDRLIDGLRQRRGDQWYRCSQAELDAAFRDYTDKRRTFEMQRTRTVSDGQRITEDDLMAAFATGWNLLTATYLLVIRFDTIERLFRTTLLADALITQPEASSGAELVINWLTNVLPQLRRTFVLLSGRPISSVDNPRIERQVQPLLAAINLRGEPILRERVFLPAFTEESGDIEQYIEAHIARRSQNDKDPDVQPYSLDKAFALTEGHPLFLSIYAETLLPPFKPRSVPPSDEALTDKKSFEKHIIKSVMNPFAARSEAVVAATLQSLYILEYARRGLTREQLRAAFDAVGYSSDQAVFDQLQEIALIKTRLLTPAPANADDRETLEEVFLLHDEIARLIDEGGFAKEEGIDKDLLEHLIEQSREQVAQARTAGDRTDSVSLLQAMASHVYYTLQGSVRNGYCLYLIYMDSLLVNEQRVDEALVLSDAFWEAVTLFAQRRDEDIPAYLNSEKGLSFDQVKRDEQVRRVKLLLARNDFQTAAKLGTELIDTYQDELDTDPYFAADLLLTTASAEIKAEPFGTSKRIEEVFTRLEESRLAAIDPDELIRKRRNYFMGVAHNIFSTLAYQNADYDIGIKQDKLARAAFTEYATSAKAINDDTTSVIALAQVNNNYAYHLLLTGNLTKARQVSQRLLDEYGKQLPPYRAALAYNTNGLILRALGLLDPAAAAIDRAMGFAETSQSRRALGMVHMARAQVRRERSVQRGEIDPEIEEDFKTAADYLSQEPDQLREVYFQWSGFTRERAVAARKRGDEQQAAAYKQQTLEYLDKALALAGERTMQTAEFLKSKAIIHNLMSEYPASEPLLDETEALLKKLQAPKYVQVICGKVAFQRGVIALRRDKKYEDALVQFVIGLARQYLYAAQHRDQADFEQRIETYIRDIPKDVLQAVQAQLPAAVARVQIESGALAYQPPEDNTEWRTALQRSQQYVLDTIDTQLEV